MEPGIVLAPVVFFGFKLVEFAVYNPVLFLQHSVLTSVFVILALLVSGVLTFKEIWSAIKKSLDGLINLLAFCVVVICIVMLYMYVYQSIFGAGYSNNYYHNNILQILLQHFALTSVIIITILMISGILTFKEIKAGIKGLIDFSRDAYQPFIVLCKVIAYVAFFACSVVFIIIFYTYTFDNIFGTAHGIDYYFNLFIKS